MAPSADCCRTLGGVLNSGRRPAQFPNVRGDDDPRLLRLPVGRLVRKPGCSENPILELVTKGTSGFHCDFELIESARRGDLLESSQPNGLL